MGKLLVLCVLAAGCDLYWGGGGGDDVCTSNGGAYGGDNLRDPDTGTCSYYGGATPCCGSADCTVAKTPVPPSDDWASCDGRCEALNETECLAATGCRAAYLDNRDTPAPVFWGCWGTAPSGPIEGGGCTGLNAYSCSRHDDCSAVYGGTDRTTFDACIAEPGVLCSTDSDCGGDQRCDTTVCHMAPCPDCPTCGACAPTCYGVCAPKSCDTTTCAPGTHCVEECDPCLTTDCAMSCGATCVSNDPGQCYGAVTCNSAPPQCPASTTPGVANGCYTGYCIPIAACNPNDPGQCYAPTTCDIAAPNCPSGTLPGIVDGCYSGFCIPTSYCEAMPL